MAGDDVKVDVKFTAPVIVCGNHTFTELAGRIVRIDRKTEALYVFNSMTKEWDKAKERLDGD